MVISSLQCLSCFYSLFFVQNQIKFLGWSVFYLLYIYLIYLCIVVIVKIVNGCKRMTDFAANSFTENSILDVCLGSRCASAGCSKLFLFQVLWRLFLCHRNYVTLFFSEIPLPRTSCLIETIQFILVCEIAFALLDFYWEYFPNRLKLICLLISTMERRFQKCLWEYL